MSCFDGRGSAAGLEAVVVPGTAPEWRLRDGHTVLDIYDLKYNPTGATPGTHTISPDVEREMRTFNDGK